MVKGVAWVASGVVEVAALLGSVKGGFCRSSATWAVVYQITAVVEDTPGPAKLVLTFAYFSHTGLFGALAPPPPPDLALLL